MDAMSTSFGEVILWSFWFFIWLCALMLWFRCLIHLFQDDDLGGWAKAGWTVFLTILPWLGVLVYLIARGRDRRDPDEDVVEEGHDQHVTVAKPSSSAGDQIAAAKSLLDSGTITQPEFETLKAKVLG
jgi:hypothetical protein